MVCSRPCILYAVGVMAGVWKSHEQDWNEVKWILQYLKRLSCFGIILDINGALSNVAGYIGGGPIGIGGPWVSRDKRPKGMSIIALSKVHQESRQMQA